MRTPDQTAAADQFVAIVEAELNEQIETLRRDLAVPGTDRAHLVVDLKTMFKKRPASDLENWLAIALVRLAEQAE